MRDIVRPQVKKSAIRKIIADEEFERPSLTLVRSGDSSLTLRKTIAQSFSLRRATLPQEWNNRPALSGKTPRGAKRPEGGLLCRPFAQYPTKSQRLLARLHDLPLS